MTEQDIINNAIASDAGVWFECWGRIQPKDPSEGLKKPRMNYLQRKIQQVVKKMEDLKLPVRIVGLKPRQKGSTTFFAATTYCHLRRKPARAVVIAGQGSQTKEVWEMLKTYQNNDRFNWHNTGDVNQNEGRWSNGSRLDHETAGDRLAGIAGTIQILHATEVARWPGQGVANAGEVLSNILKSVPDLPNTTVIIESTAEGNTGSFHDAFVRATDADEFLAGRANVEPGKYVRVFAPFFEFDDSGTRLTNEQKRQVQENLDDDPMFAGEKILIDTYGWDDNGVKRLGKTVKNFDAWEVLAWRRSKIDSEECKKDVHNFERDYPYSWQSAFQSSGNLRFNQTGLAVLRKRLAGCHPQYGLIEENRGRMIFTPTEKNEAQFAIFEPPTVGRRYILPVDPMTGATQTGGKDPDYHSGWILREGFWGNTAKWTRHAGAARIVKCRWDIDVLELAIWKLARYYGPSYGCTIAIEMNQDRGLTELLKARSANLYQREIFNQRESKLAKAYGYLTDVRSRETLVERLAKAIREWDTPGEGIDIWDEGALEELENFIVKANGRSEAGEKFHDDDIFGIGLGLLLIEHGTIMPPRQSGNWSPMDPLFGGGGKQEQRKPNQWS